MLPSEPKPDFPGVVLCTVGLFGLVYGIIEAGSTSRVDGTAEVSVCRMSTLSSPVYPAYHFRLQWNPPYPLPAACNLSSPVYPLSSPMHS